LAGSGSVFYALQGGFEDNSEKLEEGEFAHMQKQNCTCIPLIERCHDGYLNTRILFISNLTRLRLCLKESMKGGVVTKRASSFIYNIPSTYTGEIFGLINFE